MSQQLRENYNKSMNEKLKLFDESLFRMTCKHSWYKHRNLSCFLRVVPVLGNVQEPGKKWLDCKLQEPSNYKDTDILWHFDGFLNFCYPWHTEPHPLLKEIIEANKVFVEDAGNLFFHKDSWMNEIHAFTDSGNNNILVNCFEALDSSIEQWNHFRGIYKNLVSAAKKISVFLIDHPEIPLPVMKSYSRE